MGGAFGCSHGCVDLLGPTLRAWELNVPMLGGQCSLGSSGHRAPYPNLPLICSSHGFMGTPGFTVALYLCLL